MYKRFKFLTRTFFPNTGIFVLATGMILLMSFKGLSIEAKAGDIQRIALSESFVPAYRWNETPRFAVKSNLVFDMSSSMNLGVEFGMSRKLTLDLPFTLNPWTYNSKENSKFKFLLIQPELRYWICEAFNGHFFGLHGHYAYYNVGRLPNPVFSETMQIYRFEGQLAGAGISYGYHRLISPRWSVEAEVGAGYTQLWYDKYPCQSCSKRLAGERKNYWGLTRAGISLIYHIF